MIIPRTIPYGSDKSNACAKSVNATALDRMNRIQSDRSDYPCFHMSRMQFRSPECQLEDCKTVDE
jgi:hypothetical protein